MASSKLSALPVAAPALTDLLYLTADPGGTPTSKRSTVGDVLALGGGGVGLEVLGTFVPPVDTDFSWVNQDSATTTQYAKGIVMTGAVSGAGDFHWSLRVKTAPATPYTVTAYFYPSSFRQNFHHNALIFRDSGTGRFAGIGLNFNSFAGNFIVNVGSWASATATNLSPINFDLGDQPIPYWVRIADDGVNRTYSVSLNGVSFLQQHTEAHAYYFTPNQIGFGMNRRTGGTPLLTLLSWAQS